MLEIETVDARTQGQGLLLHRKQPPRIGRLAIFVLGALKKLCVIVEFGKLYCSCKYFRIDLKTACMASSDILTLLSSAVIWCMAYVTIALISSLRALSSICSFSISYR